MSDVRVAHGPDAVTSRVFSPSSPVNTIQGGQSMFPCNENPAMTRICRLVACGIMALGAVACAAGQTHRLKMGEMQGLIGEMTGLAGDPLENEPVEYVTVGKPKY